MGNIINTAPCRFCGQMVQIDSEEKLTQPQAEEQATMSLNLRGGVKASISQNSKGEINVERTETKKQKLTE